MNSSKEEHLKQILSDAMICFKNRMNFDISFDNTVLAFLHLKTVLRFMKTFVTDTFLIGLMMIIKPTVTLRNLPLLLLSGKSTVF